MGIHDETSTQLRARMARVLAQRIRNPVIEAK